MARNEETVTTKRAEDLRKRRTQRSQQRIASVGNRVVNPVNPRPVIVRGNRFGTPIHRQAGTNARRQFYITMDQASGTELRLPAISLTAPSWRLLSGLIASLALLGIFSVFNSPFFRVQAVSVHGLQRLSSSDLTNALNLENLSIVEISQQEIYAKVNQKFPELINVQVEVGLPNSITISARERQPVLAWQKGDQTRWVDSEGILFQAIGDAGPLVTIHSQDELPVAPALTPTATETSVADASLAVGDAPKPAAGQPPAAAGLQKLDPSLLQAAQSLSQKLPPETALVYGNANGLGWQDAQGWQVYIGKDLSSFDAKYATYQHIASNLADQGIHPALISVEQLNAPFYRLEQ